ncbi:membrane protein insertase YidC [Erysipelothrix sp. HDW6C]|uniref:membrane protein insertase YidC n=1 Tax=Erysipelothrix sp. HDW6C TaxID=2714930 RepID=UPI00140DEFE4|nr:membrane protein insertase YidC [Erysipelothrix sp. HDW6C]QIK69078.1 membrane protein insertase YidC [Erysipelothrix sp. HDW6C]
MKKHKKILLLGLLLILLTGCTSYIDPATKQVYPESIIHLGDAWTWGVDSWFGAIFVWPMAQILNFFAQYTGAFLSIVIVTVLIRLVTLRSSIKSTVQQQKMQLLGPDQARIEEKYRNRTDQQSKMAKATEMQKLFEKHDIKPMAALGGQFLQLPIMIAMYQAVTRADLIISGKILGESLERTPVQGFQEGNVVYIVIFALMVIFQALSMFLPQYLTKRKMKKRPGDKPAANPGQSMMYMSLAMITFFALQWNIGMSLYWMISALAQLLQTLYINNKYANN